MVLVHCTASDGAVYACAGPESTPGWFWMSAARWALCCEGTSTLDLYGMYLVIRSSRQGSDDWEAPRAGGTERDWHLLCIAKQRTAFLSHLVNACFTLCLPTVAPFLQVTVRDYRVNSCRAADFTVRYYNHRLYVSCRYSIILLSFWGQFVKIVFYN